MKTHNPETPRRKHRGSKLCDIILSDIFGENVSLGKGNNRKNKQMRLHQNKRFYTVKETINKTRRQLSERE